MTDAYRAFLETKVKRAPSTGFAVDLADLSDGLKEFNKVVVKWALAGGCRAIFAKFGLHKTRMQLELMRQIGRVAGGRQLIVAPLGVRQEFFRDARALGLDLTFIRRTEEAAAEGCYLTNYESVRDGKVDPNAFLAASLDEASVLRSFGSKTYQTFLTLFARVRFRFVATATPSPNRFKELIHYAGFLGVMDTGQALAQPLGARILTPTGWRLMGDLTIGDDVIAANGRATRVLGVYPQGLKPIFKVTFSDGAVTRCTADHLWLTRTQYQRNAAAKFSLRNPTGDASHYWTVKTTKEIADSLVCPGNGSKNHEVPTVAPVEFEARETPVDPWLLGLLLGDGHLRTTSVQLSTADAWIAERVSELALALGLTLVKRDRARADGQACYDYKITGGKANRLGRGRFSNPLLHALRGLDLLEKRAWDKFIPDAYLFNTPAVRLAVLQGLMDSDGTISSDSRNRTTRITTVSSALADGIVFLARSLGGTATSYKRLGRKPSGDEGRT